jgi:hypothetical protein
MPLSKFFATLKMLIVELATLIIFIYVIVKTVRVEIGM